jgi:Xaa-Pro aminopeptidase
VHYSADEDSVVRLVEDGIEAFAFEPNEDPYDVLRAALPAGRVATDLRWWTAAETRGLGIELEDCSDVLTELRAVKSEWEQECLRRCGAVTVAVMDHLEAAADGSTARELGAALYAEAIAQGSGPFTSIPYVAVGDATFENHTTWDWHGRQDTAEQVCGSYLFEFATSVEGYGVPLSRSRTEDRDGRRALEAVERGVARVREALRPGARANDLHEAMRSSIEDAGFRFAHRAGYSIGLGDLETWMEGAVALLGPQDDRAIEPGMAFHVVGSVVEPGRFGVARSNSLLVTEDECEVLSA